MDFNEKVSKFLNEWVQATKEQFTEHPTANLFRKDLKQEIEHIVKQTFESFDVKASVGAGNWANVPWISILNPAITSTTQDGIYPVYLFNADGSGFYLSLNQGTTIPTQNFGKLQAEKRAQAIKERLLKKFPELKQWGMQDIDLKAGTTLGKSYEKPNIAAKFYDCSAVPDSSTLINDLKALLKLYKDIEVVNFENLLDEEISNIRDVKKVSIFSSTTQQIALSKPFLLLAGISGTGKTRFVREQVKMTGQFNETYCLTSVRPDWHAGRDRTLLMKFLITIEIQPALAIAVA